MTKKHKAIGRRVQVVDVCADSIEEEENLSRFLGKVGTISHIDGTCIPYTVEFQGMGNMIFLGRELRYLNNKPVIFKKGG